MRPRLYHYYGAGQLPSHQQVGMAAPEGPPLPHGPPCPGHCQEYSRHMPPTPSREHRPPLRRTIFITNLPLTIDNGLRLLPYVPGEGLIELRVKRSGGRDVGFAEYETGDFALRALRWFQKVAVTAQIAYDCSKVSSSTWAPTQSRFRYPVPYEEYNCCEADPVRSTELLLNSVILIAEWSLSSPACRPKYLSPPPSVHPPNYLVGPHSTSGNTDPAAALHLVPTGTVGWQPQLGPPPPGSRGAGPPTGKLDHSTVPRAPVYTHHHLSQCYGVPSTHCGGAGGNLECLFSAAEAARGGVSQIPSHRVHEVPLPSRGDWERGTPPYDVRATLQDEKLMPGSSSGLVATPTLIKDELLPSSTLFVRVTGARGGSSSGNDSQPCGTSSGPPHCLSPTTSLGPPSPSLTGRGGKLSAYARQCDERREPHPLELLYEWWSQFHHRHRASPQPAYPPEPSSPESPNNQVGSTATSPDEEVATASTTATTVSTSASRVPDGDNAETLMSMILSQDFYSERFAGFRSYVGFSRWSAFVRFDRPVDALQCLRWLRQQPVLRKFVSVQFAREDTRQARPPQGKKEVRCC